VTNVRTCKMRPTLLSGMLALVGGYVDTICFVRFGIFTTTVTGNLVFIGRSVLSLLVDCPKADADGQPLCATNARAQMGNRLAAIVSHLMGVLVITIVQRHASDGTIASKVAPALGVLVVSADLLPAAAWYGGMGAAATQSVRVCAMLPVAGAMGASYFISSTAGGLLNASAFDTTSHSHRLVSAVSAALDCQSAVVATHDPRVGQSAAIAVGMLLGALLGAVAMFWNPFCYDCDGDSDDSAWLFVPAAAALFAIFCAHDAPYPEDALPAALKEPLRS
jgi:hypothetical protein